ncbi:MAG: hypothetical protein Q9218_003812 [Villophora microphyllina]
MHASKAIHAEVEPLFYKHSHFILTLGPKPLSGFKAFAKHIGPENTDSITKISLEHEVSSHYGYFPWPSFADNGLLPKIQRYIQKFPHLQEFRLKFPCKINYRAWDDYPLKISKRVMKQIGVLERVVVLVESKEAGFRTHYLSGRRGGVLRYDGFVGDVFRRMVVEGNEVHLEVYDGEDEDEDEDE